MMMDQPIKWVRKEWKKMKKKKIEKVVRMGKRKEKIYLTHPI